MSTSTAARRVAACAPLAEVLIAFLPALAAAQDAVTSFDRLNTRIRVGDTIWVTDTQGVERQGTLRELHDASLTLAGTGGETLQAGSVRTIEARKRDSKKDGMFIGIAAGAVTGWLIGREAMGTDDTSGDEEVWIFVGLYAGAGAGVGALVDALIPGKRQVAYRAPGAGPAARLSIAPVLTRRTKGLALTYSF